MENVKKYEKEIAADLPMTKPTELLEHWGMQIYYIS